MSYRQSFIRVPVKASAEDQVKTVVPNLEYEIGSDFIGIFDNIIPKDYCQAVIDHFEALAKQGLAYRRSQSYPEKAMMAVQDTSVDFANGTFFLEHEISFISAEFSNAFWNLCYPLYLEKFAVLKQFEKHSLNAIKIQRTVPGEGYHFWHCEAESRASNDRILAFSVYLNDVAEGGETEFLYLNRRIEVKAGRLLVWPAGFTHTHRGNPPLKEAKYILTGWITF